MLITVDPADSRPIYLQIMDEIRRARALGTVRPEDPLPSVRELSSELRINPKTVQQAYRELEREGALYVRRGQGCFVAPGEPLEEEREALVAAVARRALLDAHRHGLDANALVRAVEREAQLRTREDA
jgi:GntR family transcriptional regulator